MKLYELLSVLDDSIDLWVSTDMDYVEHYDGKNSIDEMYNNYDVTFITRNGFCGLVVDAEKGDDK